MRLIEFLIAMLEAHGQTLQRLAALLGEEWLIELLEMDPDPTQATPTPTPPRPEDFEDSGNTTSQVLAYASLEGSVREMNLPAMLEFHLWAYPHYRKFIESPIDLQSKLKIDAAERCVDEAVQRARQWIRSLPVPPDLGKRAEAAAEIPWLRFRTEVLRRIGRRPLGAV